MYTDEFARQRDAAAFCFVVALMGLVVLLLATPWLLAVCASVLLVVGYFVVEDRHLSFRHVVKKYEWQLRVQERLEYPDLARVVAVREGLRALALANNNQQLRAEERPENPGVGEPECRTTVE